MDKKTFESSKTHNWSYSLMGPEKTENIPS